MTYRSSYLKETVTKAAAKSKIELKSQDISVIGRLNSQLDNKLATETDIRTAMMELRKQFGDRFKDWDYRDIGNDVSGHLLNKRIF